jgi:hypothetical protein
LHSILTAIEAKQKEYDMLLQPTTKCGANLGGGKKCEENAKVIDTAIVYRKEFDDQGFEQIVDEVCYTMECPKCGTWTRAATMHSTSTFATAAV